VRQARGGGLGWRALGDLRRILRSPQIRLALGNGDSKTALPHAIFIPPQFALYRQVSQQIHQIFRLKPLQNPNGSLKPKNGAATARRQTAY